MRTFALGLLFLSQACLAGSMEVVALGEGVYAALRKEPPGLTVNANSVFIINEYDVVVVDSTLTPQSAEECIAALRTLTSKPVRYVINTHWHDDHILGNASYRAAWPGVQFIGHAALHSYLPGTGLANRQSAISSGYPGFIGFLKSTLEKGQSPAGGALDAEEKQTLASDLQIAESYLAQNKNTPVILPDIAVYDKLSLQAGSRRIDVLYLGRDHTSGDIVVHLPQQGLLVAGDLVMAPLPYVGNPQSHPGDWARSLQALIALKPQRVVPGHGPLLEGSTHMQLLAELFASIDQQVRAAVARGDTLEQARKAVNLDAFKARLIGDSRMRRMVFGSYVTGPAIAAAYADAKP